MFLLKFLSAFLLCGKVAEQQKKKGEEDRKKAKYKYDCWVMSEEFEEER